MESDPIDRGKDIKDPRETGAGPAGDPPPPVTIRLSRNGSLKVEGSFLLLDEDGETIAHPARVSFCRCGGTQTQPFCDGTHKTNGFCSRRAAAP
jgi:CDGSH-type Zn-finger protein